jgi:hypothetical protein
MAMRTRIAVTFRFVGLECLRISSCFLYRLRFPGLAILVSATIGHLSIPFYLPLSFYLNNATEVFQIHFAWSGEKDFSFL